jgi:hypothetical protein
MSLIGQPNIGGTWSVSYQIPADILTSYLNSNITGQVKVICEVMYDSQKYEIFTIQNFSFSVQDLVAPRISDTYHIPNGEPNPTNISFYARVQEYGSGIEDVILYYYFEAIENQGGSGSTLLQTELAAQMTLFNESTTSNLFAVTVAFHPNGTNWRVIYRISTSDKAGNVNPNSFNVLLDDSDSLEKYNIPFNPPGLPEWLEQLYM